MPRRLLLVVLALTIAGCASPAPTPDAEPPTPTPSAPPAPPAVLGADAPSGEPDLVVLPSGRVLVCALPQRSSEGNDLWRSDDGESYERIAHPPVADPLIDCAWGVDADARAYYVTSTTRGLLLASAPEGDAFEHVVTTAARPGAYDRPWIAGGEGGAALAIAYDGACACIVGYATEDGGATWNGPHVAVGAERPALQSFSNVAWLGGASFAFAFALLEQAGIAVEARDVWLARSDDGGRTWRHEPVAVDVAGNVGHIFPAIAADARGNVSVAWAQERGDGSVGVLVARRDATTSDAWPTPVPVHGDDASGILPRISETPDGPVIAYYHAHGAPDPQQEPATWNLTLARLVNGTWTSHVVGAYAHNGTVTTGGYGTLPRELLDAPVDATANAQGLLHNVGLAPHPHGGVVVAWTHTSDNAADARVLVARQP